MSHPTEIDNIIPTLHDRDHLYGLSNAPILLNGMATPLAHVSEQIIWRSSK